MSLDRAERDAQRGVVLVRRLADRPRQQPVSKREAGLHWEASDKGGAVLHIRGHFERAVLRVRARLALHGVRNARLTHGDDLQLRGASVLCEHFRFHISRCDGQDMEGRSRGLVIGAVIRTVRIHPLLGRLLFSDEAERGNGGLLEAAGKSKLLRNE